jgi:hypothetical protein
MSYGLFDNKPQKFVAQFIKYYYLFRIMYILMHVILIVFQLNTLSTHNIYNIHEETDLTLINWGSPKNNFFIHSVILDIKNNDFCKTKQKLVKW